MLKKVKQRQYKSKREFKDDLDLIWSNCFAYNSSENHPLRLCATRLKAKAEKLLRHITDRKPRTDPDIPEELANPNATSTHRLSIKLNGHINGHSKHGTPTIKLPTSRVGIATKITSRSNLHSRSPSTPNLNGPILFPDSPALVRTPAGMAAFLEIDQALETHCNAPSDEASAEAMLGRLKELLPGHHELEDDESEADFIKEENDESVGLAALGNKRKLLVHHFFEYLLLTYLHRNGIDYARPRKRIRYSPNLPSRVPVPPVDDDPLSHFWWEQVQSPFLAANAVPHIPFPLSSSSPYPNAGPSKTDEKPKLVKRKRRRKNPALRSSSSSASTLVENLDAGAHPRMYKNESKSLLGIMSNNVRTMKRVRHTHAKFVALGLGKDGEDGEPGPSKVEVESMPRVKLEHVEEEVGILDDRVDERPWIAGLARSSSDGEDDVEVGERNATDCLHWMGEKMLEHVGFQGLFLLVFSYCSVADGPGLGTSKVALDVIAGVTSEYLMNVGRTIRYLIDKHGHSMSAEVSRVIFAQVVMLTVSRKSFCTRCSNPAYLKSRTSSDISRTTWNDMVLVWETWKRNLSVHIVMPSLGLYLITTLPPQWRMAMRKKDYLMRKMKKRRARWQEVILPTRSVWTFSGSRRWGLQRSLGCRVSVFPRVCSGGRRRDPNLPLCVYSTSFSGP